MVFRSGLWLLLVACAGAYQNYDDAHLQNFDDNIFYNDDGYADYGLTNIPENLPKDLMMLKLINMSRKRSGEGVDQHNRLRADALEQGLPLGPHKPSDLKAVALEKTLIQASTNVKPTKKKVTRNQPRWRIKRPPRLCLLKLCAPYYVYE